MSGNGGDVNILCWQGYEQAQFKEPFEKRLNAIVHGECFESDMQAVERVRQEDRWDLININNPYAGSILYPENLIVPLSAEDYGETADHLLPQFDEFFSCGWSPDGSSLLGICQRFGPFNLVINTELISAGTARSEGFLLADDPGHRGSFGMLDYPEFNAMHAAIACGLDPFKSMMASELAAVKAKYASWKSDACIFTGDHHALNKALIDGEIRFYISGGSYTAAVARLQGHYKIEAVTPTKSPLGGRGGIAFVEVTSICRRKRPTETAEAFLHYMLEPAQCHRISMARETHNPVAQMGDRNVMELFRPEELKALQWDTLEEDMSRCAPYALIPDLAEIVR